MRSGFTLIELLIVAVLLGVVAAIAAPRIGGVVPMMQLRGAARQVADVLKNAQIRAANEGQAVYVEYDLTKNAILVLGDLGSGEGPPRPEMLPDGISIAAVRRTQKPDTASGLTRVAVFPSGYISPHSVVLRDSRGESITLRYARLRVGTYRD